VHVSGCADYEEDDEEEGLEVEYGGHDEVFGLETLVWSFGLV